MADVRAPKTRRNTTIVLVRMPLDEWWDHLAIEVFCFSPAGSDLGLVSRGSGDRFDGAKGKVLTHFSVTA
jgi:hypothetical protein